MIQVILNEMANGYSVEVYSVTNDEHDHIDTYVYEIDGDERHAFGRAVEGMAEAMGYGHNKFAVDNIRVTWDKPGREADADADMERLLAP